MKYTKLFTLSYRESLIECTWIGFRALIESGQNIQVGSQRSCRIKCLSKY